MHIPDILALALCITTVAAAATPDAPRPFYLKTRTLAGEDACKNDLYVQSYHTGAGQSDAALGPKDVAVTAILNGTSLQFLFGTPFPWGLDLRFEPYTQWSSVGISPGYGTADFILFPNSTLVWNSSDFGGWLACDWSHGVPQLFWRYGYLFKKASSNCALVDLVAEYV